jgi:hypothetical protein
MNTDYNPWSDKPRWCQPWTILLTGFSIIGGSWLLFHRVWLTGLVTVPIGVWMGFFVLLWPNLMRTAMAEAQTNASVQND